MDGLQHLSGIAGSLRDRNGWDRFQDVGVYLCVALSYSPFHGFWQSFITKGSCNHLMRIISTYVGNTKKSEISLRYQTR